MLLTMALSVKAVPSVSDTTGDRDGDVEVKNVSVSVVLPPSMMVSVKLVSTLASSKNRC